MASLNSQRHYVDLYKLSFKGEKLTYKDALEKEDGEGENEEEEVKEEEMARRGGLEGEGRGVRGGGGKGKRRGRMSRGVMEEDKKEKCRY